MEDFFESARALYDQFKALHPNTGEGYNPALANIARWRWHIAQAQAAAVYPRFRGRVPAHELKRARAWAYRRRPGSFRGMDAATQIRYQFLADRFAGIQIYACGSRADGSYADAEGFAARMRHALGKPARAESDYDICCAVPPGETYASLRARLPYWGDLLPFGSAVKIPLPMWDFSKLPAAEHARVIALYEAGDWGELTALHDQYNLSPYNYCCTNSGGGIRRWYAWGIARGLISNPETPPGDGK